TARGDPHGRRPAAALRAGRHPAAAPRGRGHDEASRHDRPYGAGLGRAAADGGAQDHFRPCRGRRDAPRGPRPDPRPLASAAVLDYGLWCLRRSAPEISMRTAPERSSPRPTARRLVPGVARGRVLVRPEPGVRYLSRPGRGLEKMEGDVTHVTRTNFDRRTRWAQRRLSEASA